MKVAGVLLFYWCLLVDLESLRAITVKPSSSQPTSQSELKPHKSPKKEEDRVARYIPFVDSRQQQLDNLNLVRYLQSLPKNNPPQIPSIAYLYGAAIKQTPLVQAGFIYKARPQKDSYQSATMFPIYSRQPSDAPKYQPTVYNQKHAPVLIPKAKYYTPFLPSNKVPGEWLPISQPHHYIKGQVESVENDFASHFSLSNSADGGPSSAEEHFISLPVPKQQQQQHVPTSTPSTTTFAKHYTKSDTNSIKILNPEQSNYALLRYAAKATTAAPPPPPPIAVTSSDQPSRPPLDDSYEFEEQVVYALPPQIANKSASIISEKLASTSENVKPHLNLTPVPNDLTRIYGGGGGGKPIKSHASNDADGDYYDYDDSVKDGSPTPNNGRPGIDFPIFHEIPETSFSCKEQRYKGFFGDPETQCQVWHYCDLNGGKASFLCPNGTIFSQTALTCDWWFNVKCSTTAQLYVLNERLYKFILPFTPKFPQDFQGPLVDKYLALKFKEMEEALQKEEEEKKNKKAEEERQQQQQQHEERERDEEELVVPLAKVVEETTDNAIESASNTQLVHATEPPATPTSTLVYVRQEEQSQLESAAVEIHNPGMTGHLQRLINSGSSGESGENLES